MIYPPFLQNGSVIGVTAPSLRVTAEDDKRRFESGVRNLAGQGYKVIFTDSVFSDGEESSPPDVRIRELKELFSDEKVRFISLAKGGFGESEIIPGMDWDLMGSNPKWVQGYSDNTILVFKYTVDGDVATIYGSNFGDYGMVPWHRSVSENIEILSGRRTGQVSFDHHETGFHDRITGTEPFQDDADTKWVSLQGDTEFSGRMIGGCMDVLKWFIDNGGADVPGFIRRYRGDSLIWYMETYDLPYPDMKDMFSRMASEGWLERVSGFIFGRPFDYPGEDYIGDVCSLLSDYDVPKVFDADIGHLAPRMTMINGAYSKVAVSSGKGKIEYDFR